MTILAFALVLVSALAHSTWNYLTKASRDTHAFTWAYTVVSSLIYVPLAILAAFQNPPPISVALFVGGTVALHLMYFRLLSLSYARADLSVVYPVARGTGIFLIPLGAAILLGERISPAAVLAIGVILLGVLVVHTRGRGFEALRGIVHSLREPGSALAALTGLVIASYSLWDKHALGQIDPIVINAGIFAGQALFNAPYMLTRRRQAVLAEVQARPIAVIVAGILAPLAYLLVLTALTFTRVAYIAPTREIGIVIGTLLGARTLKEPYPANRIIGAALIVLGVFGLALAP